MSDLNQSVISFSRKSDNYQPNPITESRQEFSEIEKKIVVYVINQLGQVAKDWKGQNISFPIPFTELTGTNHAKIKKTAESIITKRITLLDKVSSSDNETYYHLIIPFTEVLLRKINGKDYLQVVMNSSVVPFFIELGKHFTKYSLDIMLSLGSIYAQRMYEIIMLHVGRKQRKFNYTVEKLKFMFNCPESYTYNEVRRWALDVAQKELREKANIIFTYEPSKKEGKRIVELQFYVKTELEISLEAIANEAEQFERGTPIQQRDCIMRLLNNYSFTREQQTIIMGDKEKWAIFLKIDSEIYNGVRKDIDNPTAYIAKSLGFNVSAKKKR
ncbi:MAG: replication initiation protein [Spirosomaceae bacterium]|jgi:plasmid replication initiation protein|nr:replication initiation protein [Spirosomataceae bacterium]